MKIVIGDDAPGNGKHHPDVRCATSRPDVDN